MQGFFGDVTSVQFLNQQVKRLNQASSSNQDKNQLVSLLQQQNSLIQKLLEKQNILSFNLSLARRQQTTDSQLSEPQFDCLQSVQSHQNQFLTLESIHQNLQKQKRQFKILKNQAQPNNTYMELDGSSSESQPKNKKHSKSLTKKYSRSFTQKKEGSKQNKLIRQFVKGLQLFLRKKQHLTLKILNDFELKSSQFDEFVAMFSEKIKSLADLNNFWKEQKGSFGKVLRILLNLYLKKFMSADIFERKQQSISVCLNFRYKLMRNLEKIMKKRN